MGAAMEAVTLDRHAWRGVFVAVRRQATDTRSVLFGTAFASLMFSSLFIFLN
jgi:hypothetical protein